MDVTVKYEGTSGENQGGFCYFYLKFVSSEFKKVRVENIIMEPASSRNQVYLSYMHVYDKDTLEYICSSSNATRALVPPDNVPGVWEFEKRLLLENDKTYLFTFTTSAAPSLTNLYATRTKQWPSTTEAGALDVNARGSGTATYPGTEIVYYPAITFQGEAAPVSGGSVEVGNGYCNVDGVNKIIFSNPVKKDLDNIGGTKGFKNNVVVTLDNSDVSSFILQGVEAGSPTGYKATKALDKFVYLNNNKDMILGDSPKEGLDVSLPLDVNPVGDLKISDGVVSNFSTTKYINTGKIFNFHDSDSWEIGYTIIPKTVSKDQWIFGAASFVQDGIFPLGFISGGKFALLVSYSGTSWDIDKRGTHSVQANTKYWIKYGFNGSSYYFKYSLDGRTFTEDILVSSSTRVVANTAVVVGIGRNAFSSDPTPWINNFFDGSMDLKETYVRIGTNVWKPIDTGSLKVSEGYAYADETTGTLEVSDGTKYSLQEILVHTEDFEEESQLIPWSRPNLTSATSYGVVTQSRTGAADEAGWKALDGSLSSKFVPNTGEAWWKWELPDTLKFTQASVITWVHRDNSETIGVANALQFFADEECTIPLTNTFTDPSSSNATVDLQVLSDVSTNVVYLKIANHSGWGGAAEIRFSNVFTIGSTTKIGYLSLANPSGTTKLIATGIRNPTKEYVGSVVTPTDLEKKITLSEDLSEIISVEDI